MSSKNKADGPFNISRRFLIWGYIFIVVVLTTPLIVCGLADVPATEELATVTAAPCPPASAPPGICNHMG